MSREQDNPRVVIIGGGPTGVEVAGAIAGIARRALASDFKAIDTTRARVLLLEGSGRVLGMYPEELSRKAEAQLKELGVEVRTGSLVTAVEPGRVRVGEEWVATSVSVLRLSRMAPVAIRPRLPAGGLPQPPVGDARVGPGLLHARA